MFFGIFLNKTEKWLGLRPVLSLRTHIVVNINTLLHNGQMLFNYYFHIINRLGIRAIWVQFFERTFFFTQLERFLMNCLIKFHNSRFPLENGVHSICNFSFSFLFFYYLFFNYLIIYLFIFFAGTSTPYYIVLWELIL